MIEKANELRILHLKITRKLCKQVEYPQDTKYDSIVI